MFAVAHIIYVGAFGFRPLGPLSTMAACYGLGAVVYFGILVISIEGLVMKLLVGVYIVLIVTMVWRAIVRLQTTISLTWKHICCVIGAIFFALSDTILAVDKWKFEWRFAGVAIMSTYYIGQVGITLSASN